MPDLWIGLFESEVTDCCTIFRGATYAAVNAVALADSEEQFVMRVWTELEAMGLRRIDCEGIECYEDRLASREIHESIRTAAQEALKNNTVGFGTFHTTDKT